MAGGHDLSEEAFYVELFTKNPQWSTPYPNANEAARWSKIVVLLSQIAEATKHETGGRLRLLDVGCGRGWMTNLASVYGACEGVEPVGGVIDLARRYFPSLRFYVGTLETVIGQPDFSPYDVVLTSEVLEHIPDAQKANFVQQLREAVKPNGHVILTTPRGEFLARWRKLFKDGLQPVEDWITERHLSMLFRSQGFRCLRHERAYIYAGNLSFLHRFIVSQRLKYFLELPLLAPVHEALRYICAIYQVWLFQRG